MGYPSANAMALNGNAGRGDTPETARMVNGALENIPRNLPTIPSAKKGLCCTRVIKGTKTRWSTQAAAKVPSVAIDAVLQMPNSAPNQMTIGSCGTTANATFDTNAYAKRVAIRVPGIVASPRRVW